MPPVATTLWSQQHVSPFVIDEPSPCEVWSPTVALTMKCITWRGHQLFRQGTPDLVFFSRLLRIPLKCYQP